MKMWKSRKALAVALAFIAMTVGRAYAASTTSNLNIDVTISASLSVAIEAANNYASTQTYGWSVSATSFTNSNSSVTVLNDSGGLNEKWQLSAFANSLDIGGGGAPWAMIVTTNTVDVYRKNDQFALLAMFASSATAAGGCPSVSDAQWTGSSGLNMIVSGTPTTYNDTMYTRVGDPYGNPVTDSTAHGKTGNYMYPYNASNESNPGHNYGKRALCWKVMGPAGVSTTHEQEIQMLITAVAQ